MSTTGRNQQQQQHLNLPLDSLASTANSYASANGLQVEAHQDGTSFFQCAPISLLPNAFPESEFVKAQSIMTTFNLLVDRISRDGSFLQETLGGVVSDADPYTGKLLQLYKAIYLNNNDDTKPNFAKEADYLGIFRSDYMLSRSNSDDNAYHIKQVELNTIAASFAGLSNKVAELHTFLLNRYQSESSALYDYLKINQKAIGSMTDNPTGVPVNPTMEKLPAAMNVIVERYSSRFGSSHQTDSNNNYIILFVVQEGERNTVDQRMLEFQLWNNHRIPVIRRSLAQIYKEVEFDSDTGLLTIQVAPGTKKEIALVYYRAGYAPTDYPDGYDGIEWQAREKLERSRAAKCPSLGYHLAGTKKVQQALARPGVVEQFFDEKENQLVDKMRKSFAGLYSLDANDAVEEDYDVVRQVLSTENGRKLYVLKPQREGGGYNFYGNNLHQKLKDNVIINEEKLQFNKELGEYILMERLFPPQQQAILLRSGRVEGVGETISELGCFGTIIVSNDGKKIVHNEYAGFLLRTKFSNVDEGGVASGFATLSSPFLC